MSGGIVACVAEQVLEHRRAGARRMRALRDLGELQRVAEQDDVARGRAHRQRVGERHLPRLVDHQRVDAAPSPQPRAANSHAVPAKSSTSRRRRRTSRRRSALVIEVPS